MPFPRFQRKGVLAEVKHSVRKKLMLVVLATTMVALLVSGAAMVIYDLRNYHQSWVDDLFAQADILGAASTPALVFNDEKVAQENLSLLKARPGISSAAIYTATGGLFGTYIRPGVTDPKFPELPQADGYSIDGNQLALFKSIKNNNETIGTVYIKARYELVNRLQNYLLILGAVMAFSLLVAVAMTAWLQNVLTKPLLEITEVARQVMTRRDFSLRVRKTTEDEIGYLFDTFNNMLAEIGQRAQALEESNRSLEHEMGERRTAEKALLAADRRKDEFLATLAHELRNPLAPLRNALEILRTTGSNASAVQSARDMMERQLRQLIHLVNDLLDVSRITTGKMILKRERIELRNIVQNAVEAAGPLIEARKHRLTTTLPPQPVYLNADGTRLAQVFLNLLNNAAKFTEVGGNITFEAAVKGPELVITVADSGIGIPLEMLPVIFDMFAQVDHSLERTQAGLGVGLTLSQHLTELHGGTILAHSDGRGKGSQFIIRLPVLSDDIEEPVAGDLDAGGTHPAGHRILLADDNVDFAVSLCLLLEMLGHQVQVTHDGEEALKAFAAFKPDFAFLDIGLPKINGYDLVRRMRGLSAAGHCVFVAITGWGQEEDRRRAREAGFDHHLVKPVEPEQIRTILRKFSPADKATV